MIAEELERVRDWADAKLALGGEPDWALLQYIQLRESANAILAGMDRALADGGLRQSSAFRDGKRPHLRIVY